MIFLLLKMIFLSLKNELSDIKKTFINIVISNGEKFELYARILPWNPSFFLGSYKVNLPDGRVQTVTYTADHYGGFVADVKYEGESQYPPEKEYKPAPAPKYARAPKYAPGRA